LTPVTRPFGRISHIYHRIWSVCFTALFPDLLDQICLRTLAGKTKIPVKNPREISSPKHDPTRFKILLKKTRPDPTREVKTKETRNPKQESSHFLSLLLDHLGPTWSIPLRSWFSHFLMSHPHQLLLLAIPIS
jgi:hypothetical protein